MKKSDVSLKHVFCQELVFKKKYPVLIKRYEWIGSLNCSGCFLYFLLYYPDFYCAAQKKVMCSMLKLPVGLVCLA